MFTKFKCFYYYKFVLRDGFKCFLRGQVSLEELESTRSS